MDGGIEALHPLLEFCNQRVRSEPCARGADDYLDLELYVAWRGQGLPVETPAVRNQEVSMPTMRAVQVTSANGPFELVERAIPAPAPAPGQVRIRIQACGVCHSDAFTKTGAFPGIQYPRVPGHEVVGILDQVGDAVPDWRPGQRVGVGWQGGPLRPLPLLPPRRLHHLRQRADLRHLL